jgi:MFS family permease
MNRNIILSYFLAALKNSWFWLGIWVFYYLRYTNYAGIGLIETVLIVTMTVMEIPTGAIADLLGKKLTLIFSFLLQAACQLIMAFAPNLSFLLLSVFIGGIGGALYSGTIDALAYDSLKQEGREEKFSKVLGNMTSFQYIMMAVTGIVGGFMYLIEPRLPFVASGIFYLIGFMLCFLLIEPKIDTERFSFMSFINQNKQGLKQLFSSENIRKIIILLLIVSAVAEISDEILNDVLAVEFGFKPDQLGIFISVVSLIAVGISQIAPKIVKRLNGVLGITFLGILIAITYFISPWLGFVSGGASLLLRVSFQTIYNNMTSVVINKFTESKYRATTISSYNMIKNIPYVLSAFFLGSLMDIITAKRFALVLGIMMIILLLIQSYRARNLIKQAG